jgi:hypothetical protein
MSPRDAAGVKQVRFRSGSREETLVGGDHHDLLAELLLQALGRGEVNRVEAAQRMTPHQLSDTPVM